MIKIPSFTSRKGQARRSPALLSASALAVATLIVTAGSAGAAITRSAGNNAEGGGPSFFRDAQGVALKVCSAGALRCGDAFDPANASYFVAQADAGPITATYSIDAVNAATNRESRFDATGLAPGRYTIKDPWGTVTTRVGATGDMNLRIAGGRFSTFLHATTRRPAGFIGNHGVSVPVTGSPTGFNRILITGPGGITFSTNRFDLLGQMRPNTAMSSVATQAVTMGNLRNSATVVRNIPYSSFGTAVARARVTKSGANPRAFAVTNNCTAAASGTTCNIKVSYTPKPNRTLSAILTIDDNGLAAPRRVTMTAIGPDTLAPKLVSRTPAPGSIVSPGKNVGVKFSEAVRGVKSSFSLVDSAGNRVRASVTRVGQTNRYVLNPRKALPRGTRFTARIDGGTTAVRDARGNAARDIAWSFSTR